MVSLSLWDQVPMYAVIETGSKQFRVAPGDTIEVERLEGQEGAAVTLDRVLMVVGPDQVKGKSCPSRGQIGAGVQIAGDEKMNERKMLILGVAALLSVTGCAMQEGPVRLGSEESFDGLRRVENSRASAAWVRPGMDLSRYTKVRLEGAGMSFRPVTRTGRGAREFPITEDQKLRIRDILVEVFTDELKKSTRFELVEDPGPDVLTVWGGLYDVVSNVPPDPRSGDRIFIEQVGEATLVLELRDSESGATLARAVDRRAAGRAAGTMQRSTPASNWGDVRQAARRWAILLRERLDAADTWKIVGG